jgi:PAS domain S-box-containing protein
MTKDRIVTWTNNKFDEMFSYEKSELFGRSVRSLYSNDEVFVSAGQIAYPVISQGLQYETELELMRKDGSLFWARYYGKAIEPGDPAAGVIWIVEDISERKSTELALAEKSEQLNELNENLEIRVNQAIEALSKKDQILLHQARLLVDLAPEAIFVYDIGLGTIIDANRHAEELFECVKHDLYETSPLAFYKTDQTDGLPPEISFKQNISRVLDGEILVIDRAIVTRRGTERICEMRLVMMPSEERTLIRASIVDITERKKSEAELAQNFEMVKNMLEEQKQFIGLISHELRTPMAIIDGAAQLLILTACRDSACLSHAERIRAASKRLTDLVDTCLTEERLASSGWEPEMYVERIHHLIHDVVDKIQAGTEKHRIELDLSTLPSHCTCDAALVKVMLFNLLDNATKYSPEGGTISLRGWCEHQGELRIQVSDQGIGFDPVLSEKIFERYYRTWQVPGIAGAGLGLHLVKRITEIHGGGVEAKSLPDQGATFTVWIRSET